MSNLLSLTSAQLIKAANLKDRIEALTKELNGLLDSAPVAKPLQKATKKRKMSPAHKAKLIAAVKARWANVKTAKAKTAPKAAKPALKPAKKKFVMSAAAKAKLSALAKARWAAKKAAKKA